MSDHWILVVVWIEIDDEWIMIFIWICLAFYHQFAEAMARHKMRWVPVSAFTIGTRHAFPMTNKVLGVEAPEAVRREAAGGKKAPAVVYGGICNWDAEDLVDARENFDKIIWTPSAHGSFLLMLVIATLPQNYGRPLAGGATQFAAVHAKASYLEQVPGYGRVYEKTWNDGVQRHDLADVLEPRDPALELSPFDIIKRALCNQPGLHTPGDSVESKVTSFYDGDIKWNRDVSIERADEVNALVVTLLPLLATESPRTIVVAAPALKYAADIHLLHALSGMTKSDDFAIVDEKPIRGVLGPGDVKQVSVRTRTGGSDSAPTYTYKLHMYQKNKVWDPSTKPTKVLYITFELLDKLRTSGHLPEGTCRRP